MKKHLWSVFFVTLFLISCVHHDENKGAKKLVRKEIDQTSVNWIGSWKNRKSKKDLVNSVVREYEVNNQGVVVNVKYDEDFASENIKKSKAIQDTIVSMIRKKEYPWDIIPLTKGAYRTIAEVLEDPEWGKKYLVNFENYDWFRENHINKVYKVEDYKNAYGGIFAGPLIEGRSYALWYNAETAKKIGISIKQTEMTFDDLIAYCKATLEYNKTATKPISFLPSRKLNSQVTDMFDILVLSELGSLNNQLPPHKDACQAIYKGLKLLEEISKYQPVHPDVKMKKDFVDILDGNVLFEQKPSSWYNQCESVDEQKATNLIPTEMPVINSRVEYYHGDFQSVWAVFKDAPNKDEAIELMKFFTTNDVAERWLSSTYNPTGLKVKLRASDFGQNDIEKYNDYIEKKYGDNITSFNLGTLLFGKEIKVEPMKVLLGEITADDYYKRVEKQFKK